MRRIMLLIGSLCALFLLIGIGLSYIPSDMPQLHMNMLTKVGLPLPVMDPVKSQKKLIDKDVMITRNLQQSHSFAKLQTIADKLPQVIQVRQALIEEKAKYPNLEMLMWIPHPPFDNQEIHVGQLPTSLTSKLQTYIDQAKQTTSQGKSYHSPSVGEAQDTYSVIGIPSSFERSSLLAVIHQDLLHKVKDHQQKNLRLQAHPHETQPGIKTVEPPSSAESHSASNSSSNEKSHFVEHEIIVRFTQDPTSEQLSAIKQEIDARDVKKIGYTYLFTSKSKHTAELQLYFKRWPIVYAEPHYMYVTNEVKLAPSNDNVTVQFEPNDQFYAKYQWNLPQISTMKGWQFNRGTEDVIVAVVDTGVDLSHPDLASQVIAGHNLLNPAQKPQDDQGHGTHVAGIIAALTNNDLGVAGMSWFNKIMPVKVLNQEGAGSTSTVAEGIIWATDHGAKVINLSLGNYADSEFLREAVQYAFDHDVVLIAASGNDNSDRPSFPAAYPQVFAVAASDEHKVKAPFSNYGDHIDVSAPGVSIASTFLNQEYAALSGTSMASPHVAALAALIRSTNPTLTNVEVYELMRNTAEDVGKKGTDPYYGYGLIHVEHALEASYRKVLNIENSQSQVLCE